MEQFKKIIGESAAQFDASNPEASLERVTRQMEPIIRNAPPRIKEITLAVFTSCGWDCRMHKPRRGKVLVADECVQALEDLVVQLNNWNPAVLPTDDELNNFSEACSRLWELDHHRLVPDLNYRVDLQGGKNSSWTVGDAAGDNLFTFVDENLIRHQLPTYSSFIALLDNYAAQTGVREVVTEKELEEQHRFLQLVLDTGCGQYMHNYLIKLGKAPADRTAFLAMLKETWFGLYRRKVDNDSSGFEHVFLGEITEDKKVVGLHNWVQIYLEEKAGRLDYLGYIKPKRRALGVGAFSSAQQFVNVQFNWLGCLKPESICFLGTSPEFEFSLYSMAFYLGLEKSIVDCGPYRVGVSVFNYNSRGKKYIGSSFPEAPPLDSDEAATKIQSAARSRGSSRQ